ncbi:hypothetical protein cyc_03897 [Cyclospora cayetanensis]|uniref:Uncharacterized protein n=1 Tax=Cyclospora cayetanensis TaxID=88456 RepID=A0A1D3CUI8_9EIME|nr:hypothetical protein cyc_03897 [Cyclospora cayetanensis]
MRKYAQLQPLQLWGAAALAQPLLHAFAFLFMRPEGGPLQRLDRPDWAASFLLQLLQQVQQSTAESGILDWSCWREGCSKCSSKCSQASERGGECLEGREELQLPPEAQQWLMMAQPAVVSSAVSAGSVSKNAAATSAKVLDSLAAAAASELEPISLVAPFLAKAFRLFLRHRLPFLVFAAAASDAESAVSGEAAPPFSGRAALVLQHIQQLLLLHAHFKIISNKAAAELMEDADGNVPIEFSCSSSSSREEEEESTEKEGRFHLQQQQQQQQETFTFASTTCSRVRREATEPSAEDSSASSKSSSSDEAGATGAAAPTRTTATAPATRRQGMSSGEASLQRSTASKMARGETEASVVELLQSAEPLCVPHGVWGCSLPALPLSRKAQPSKKSSIGFLEYWISLDAAFAEREINTKAAEGATTQHSSLDSHNDPLTSVMASVVSGLLRAAHQRMSALSAEPALDSYCNGVVKKAFELFCLHTKASWNALNALAPHFSVCGLLLESVIAVAKQLDAMPEARRISHDVTEAVNLSNLMLRHLSAEVSEYLELPVPVFARLALTAALQPVRATQVQHQVCKYLDACNQRELSQRLSGEGRIEQKRQQLATFLSEGSVQQQAASVWKAAEGTLKKRQQEQEDSDKATDLANEFCSAFANSRRSTDGQYTESRASDLRFVGEEGEGVVFAEQRISKRCCFIPAFLDTWQPSAV